LPENRANQGSLAKKTIVVPDQFGMWVLGALIAISTGVEDASKLGVAVEVGRRLLACFDGLSEE
jgi:hypothetical protein